MNKADFDNNVTSFNNWIISNKTKYLGVQKKLGSLITKSYNFCFGRTYFASNDGSHNTFVHQPTLDALE